AELSSLCITRFKKTASGRTTCHSSATPSGVCLAVFGAEDTSTGRGKPICVTCCGPPDRLQQLPRALSRPVQAHGLWTVFAAEWLSASAPARLRSLGQKKRRRGAASPPPLCCSPAAGASSTGDRDSSPKVMTPKMRPGGTSRGQYHSPRLERRSQERGTSISRMTTCSMRPPCRRTTWAAAHSEFAGEPNQTTGRLPWDLLVSSPARRILFRLRASVACRSRMGESLQSRGGRVGVPSPGVSHAGLLLAGPVQGQQRLAVLAVAPLQ